MRADLHVHSEFSIDAVSRPGSIIRVAEEKGIDAVAITDHDTTAGWEAVMRAAESSAVKVILGEEVKIYRNRLIVGELVCLFLQQPVESRSLPEVVAEVREQGGIVSLAHPFDKRRWAFREIDQLNTSNEIAVEVFNSRTYDYRGNERAFQFAREMGTMITAGSDAHIPREIGNAYIEAEAETLDELKTAIISGRVKVAGRRSNPLYSVYSILAFLGYKH